MKPKYITNEKDLRFLLSLEYDDIDRDLMIKLFGNFDKEPRFQPYDLIEIPPDKYGPEGKRNKNKFTTTVGLWVFNKFFIERDLFEVFQYINKTIDGGGMGWMNDELSFAVLEDIISTRTLQDHTMREQNLMSIVSILSPNHSMKMLTVSDHILKKKKELIEKYKDEIAAGDAVISEKIENELLDVALEYLGEDPSLDMYKSGSRGSLGNNFKNMFIMRGAIMDYDQTFKIQTSSFGDGISKEEYSIAANSLVAGAYAKAKNTEFGGTWAKIYTRAFQHLVLLEKGTDCKTKRHIEVELTNKNFKKYMYNYIIVGDKLVCLDRENSKKYIGKKVKMRFSTMCENPEGFCNICIGELFYKLEIDNIGMTTIQIPNKIMLLSMKKFHDATIKVTDMDVNRAFGV